MVELHYIIIKVKDLARAKRFYMKFLEAEPIKEEGNRMVVFLCGNVKVGLYDPVADGYTFEDADIGNSLFPAFRVVDVDTEVKRIAKFAKILSRKKVTYHEWVEFEDSEGNILEIHK